MEETSLLLNVESLDVARAYLFGNVKFIDLLMVLIIIDIITGIVKAIKFGKLRSRSAWFGYVRKMLTFLVIIVANIIDQILGLSGVITFGTVLFYVGQEILSITENLAQVGVKVPRKIKNSLQVIEEKSEDVDK
ncbi:phage holin family protein [Rossellomorea marisflavi]|uniref:phage holin family protein n=1 Tax=Rossellomorea TaxID=2837508 RepID=UPI0007014B1C|nr:phage holin family protein [Rossellomorea marisflavi]KQU57733.1 holin [Bacillus sp. Leaf406]WJV19667.1 phage holin family protein [Rossellomorea marisflavi]